MESFHGYSIKLEKANAFRKYHHLQKITTLFRVVEICVILIILSKFSSQLPFAIKSSSLYFKDLSIAMFSPRFVFLIGNAIIITLIIKSGHFSDSKNKGGDIDNIYQEFMKKSVIVSENQTEKQRQKQSICDEKRIMVDTYTKTPNPNGDLGMKIYKGSKSEKFTRAKCENGTRVFRRNMSATDEKMVMVKQECEVAEDKLSNEEFKCIVEAFIARQQRFLREEEDEE